MKYQKKRQESMFVAALKNQKGFLKSDNQIQTKIFTGQLESVHTQECLFSDMKLSLYPSVGKSLLIRRGNSSSPTSSDITGPRHCSARLYWCHDRPGAVYKKEENT